MLFPDCRNDNYYNEDFLNNTDREFVGGYDWAVDTIDNLFENLGMLTGESDTVERFLKKSLPASLTDSYTMDLTYPSKHQEEREVKTYGDYIRMKLLEWLEIQRNELITSMIDSMNDAVYNTSRDDALKKNEEAEDKKEYYDTRHFMVTGEKSSDTVLS